MQLLRLEQWFATHCPKAGISQDHCFDCEEALVDAALTCTSGERDQALEKALDFINQATQLWHNRFTFKNLRLFERYIKGELGFGVEARGILNTEKFCAFFYRRLIRQAIPKGLSLKPADAIHLSTATRHQCNEILTYDPKWAAYAGMISVPIAEPAVEQGVLDYKAGGRSTP
jgi:predicted nucleic acid-binding protein